MVTIINGSIKVSYDGVSCPKGALPSTPPVNGKVPTRSVHGPKCGGIGIERRSLFDTRFSHGTHTHSHGLPAPDR